MSRCADRSGLSSRAHHFRGVRPARRDLRRSRGVQASRVFASVCAALVASVVVGCGGEGASAGGGASEATDEADDALTTCHYPRRYFAIVDAWSCAPVPGARGTWEPKPLFPDAPTGTRPASCVYEWTGEPRARVDRAALEAYFDVAGRGAVTPACGDPDPAEADAVEIDPLLFWDPGHVGSVGCDVCGIVVGRRVWGIFPPDKIASRRIGVRLTNGESRAFQIDGSGTSRAASLTLPAPPPGVAYVQGRVLLR